MTLGPGDSEGVKGMYSPCSGDAVSGGGGKEIPIKDIADPTRRLAAPPAGSHAGRRNSKTASGCRKPSKYEFS